ncbi:MAG: alkaline phosphatase family protein [Chloroflexota bacterium]|nr:alkaline phosphatase family protein [Chloroflexota bacterium]
MTGKATTVVICIDGFDPEYLDACSVPNLREIAQKGFLNFGKSMMPSVTNVNNVSILTANYPEIHGISSNYRLVRETGEEIYMESSEYILAETMFQKANTKGVDSLLVTSKDKLRTLLSRGATVTVSSERAPEDVVRVVGEPPPIYSLEVNGWMIRAGTYLMGQMDAGIVYLTTTDYAMHTYAPDMPESQQHMKILDDAIGDLLTAFPDVTLMISADHGMSSKSKMVDLSAELAKYKIEGLSVPIIKDKYVVHHSNLGGCMFVYLSDVTKSDEAKKILEATPGVETVYMRDEASRDLRLYYDRIGDLVVTADRQTVFGDPNEVELPSGLRSHASAHEQDIPIFGYNGDFSNFQFSENRDIGRFIFERTLA